VQLKSPNSLMQVTARRDFILNLHVSILSNLPLRSPFPHNFQHLRESIFPSFVSEPIDMSSLSSFSYFHWKLVILAHPSFLHLHSKSKMLYRRHSTFPLSYLLHGISITRHFVRSYLRITHPNLRSSLSFSCVFFFVFSCYKEAKHGIIPKFHLSFPPFLLRKFLAFLFLKHGHLNIYSTWRTPTTKLAPATS